MGVAFIFWKNSSFAFSFFGGNPRKRNLSVGRPEIVNAAIEAVGPGIEWTGILDFNASLTK